MITSMRYVLEVLKEAEQSGVFEQLFPEGSNFEKWQRIAQDVEYQDIMNEIKREGEKLLNEPITALPYSLFKLFDLTGKRSEYQMVYYKRRKRLNAFAILSLAYGEMQYIEALEDILWAICDEYSWCLPAHFFGKGGTSIVDQHNHTQPVDGKVHLLIPQHKNTIDLFASETGFALAEIVHLLENKLAPAVVYRVRQEITTRILEPYCDLKTAYHWETNTNNWAAVCAGSVGAAFLYMVKDSTLLAPVIKRLMDTMACFLEGYENDGACTEGLGYWNYGFGFYVYFSELLRQRTNGLIDLMTEEKIKNMALFQQKCYLSENHIISFSDSPTISNFMPGLTCYLKSRFNKVEVPDATYKAGFHNDHCYRWAHQIRDLVWYTPDHGIMRAKDAVYYLKDAQWLNSRKVVGENIICLAAKGGHNAEPHNHNDVGSFLLHINGTSYLTDLGCGEYTKAYFSPNRYQILCNGSQGHSVPIIDGKYQQEGRDRTAEDLAIETTENKDLIKMDISKAYQNNSLNALIRTIVFEKSGNTTVTLSDTFHFSSLPESVTERFISFIEPVKVHDGMIRLATDKSGMLIQYPHDMLDYMYEGTPHAIHDGTIEQVYLLDFQMKAECLAKEMSFEIEFKPYF